jgi:hypothetical protein
MKLQERRFKFSGSTGIVLDVMLLSHSIVVVDYFSQMNVGRMNAYDLDKGEVLR